MKLVLLNYETDWLGLMDEPECYEPDGNQFEVGLFQSVFGSDFTDLPEAWQRLHDVTSRRVYEGEAKILRGSSLFCRLLCWGLRLPPTSEVVIIFIVEPLLLENSDCEDAFQGERWQRFFGKHEFTTVLSAVSKPSKQNDAERRFELSERFGLFSFRLGLSIDGGAVFWEVSDWWFAGLRLPRVLMPVSKTREYVDETGLYRFDIDISLPFFGKLIAYKGWLSS